MAYHANLPAPTFDLETWASNYEGPLLPLRLAHVATHCPPLSQQSLDLAITAAKRGKDVLLYNRLYEIAEKLGVSGLEQKDEEWMQRQEEGNKRELARLEGELRGYKNNLIRESIRMGQEDLAMHLLLTGGPLPDPQNPQSATGAGYNAAYQAFGKMRDYCTTPSHVASMTLRLIHTALLQAVATQQTGGAPHLHLNAALANANRLRSVGIKEEEMVRITPIMHVSGGLAHLGAGSYPEAAVAFLSTPFEYASQGVVQGTNATRAIASGNDVAIYGGLCALATMTRDTLNDTVLAGPFRAFLELEPHLRKAISLYTTAKYQACLDTLRRYYSDWSLDVFLGAQASPTAKESHLDRLILRIREKSITAYLSSFAQVSLASLASTFPPLSSDPQAMEDEILSMIEAGMLDARLDVVKGLVIAPQKEARKSAHAAAAAAAEEVERTLLLRLHRVNVTLAGLEIPKAKTGNWSGTGGEGMRLGNGGFP
ncbi:hypothetical protein BDY17DRAFT_309174 [Neohortaea acidophila]|uniref:PCI domain-containing protein n=1 Tax=Neohortaea acidophila TaxID=245834 RepID=A0A6A6Q1L9_9PEZI|nr:uncharacterized protein BDY17DRAFT_309174 [Neohortaea acidophila]KAF2485886.1 hypothetical protein BDY17DRAFT_309174 [Neohortaea acidophila]